MYQLTELLLGEENHQNFEVKMVKMASTTVSIVGKIMMISNIAAHYSHPYISCHYLLARFATSTCGRYETVTLYHRLVTTIAIVDESTRVWTVDYALHGGGYKAL